MVEAWQNSRFLAKSNSIQVNPGQSLSGLVSITVQNEHSAGAVFPVGYTPTWGDHATSFQQITGSAPAEQSTTYLVNVSGFAPSLPGTYYLFFVAAAETSLAHVMSATRWYSGPPRWNNGDDVASWGASQANSAATNGFVLAPSFPESQSRFGAAVIALIVQ